MFGKSTSPWRGRLLSVASALLLGASVAACSPPVSDEGGGSASNEIILGRSMDTTTLDISRNFCDSCQIYNGATYETLVSATAADAELEPLLAESWEANDDNTEFTFHLREDITFADGSPIEAKDVKWSWERLKNIKGNASFMMDGVSGIETPDEHTVVVTSEYPNSAFFNIASASYMGIINSDVAIENGATADENADSSDDAEQWFMQNSAGSGQYVLDSYQEGSSLVLVRNENYWGEEPNFDKVTIKDVADSSAQLQQLQQGDIDVAMQLSFDALDQIEADENIVSEVVPSYNFVYVAISPGAPDAPEALSDPQVRDAIRKAIDYDTVIDAVVAGNAEKQSTGIPNGFDGSADLPLPEYDVDAAKAQLADAGYADGFEIDVTFPQFTIYGVNFSTMFQSIQQSLSDVGITLNLNPIEYSQWSEQLASTGIAMTSVYYAPDHPDTIQYAQYFSRADGATWGERAGLPADPKQTQLMTDSLAQTGDERLATLTELGQAMYDDAIILPIANPNIILANGTNVEGNNYHITHNIDLEQLTFTD